MLKKLLVTLIALGVVCFALLQTVGLSVAYILDAPAVATGIGSKLACSGKYISGYNKVRIFDDIIEYSPVLQYLDLQYDDRQSQVTGTFFGLGKTTASYWPGLGCAIDYPGHTARNNIRAPENLQTHLAWPAGGRVSSIDDNSQQMLEKIVERDNRIGLDTRALLVVKNGRIVAETYAQGVGPDSMLLGWSMAKSLTGILIGHLVYTGRLALDAKGLFEPWKEDERKNIALTDMLTMTDGLDFSEVYEPGGNATTMLFMQPSAADYAMAKPLKHPKGTINGHRIVSEKYVSKATSPNTSSNDLAYGYQFWLNRGNDRPVWPHLPEDTFAAEGDREQRVMVIPSENLVIVRIGWSEGQYPADANFSEIVAALH